MILSSSFCTVPLLSYSLLFVQGVQVLVPVEKEPIWYVLFYCSEEINTDFMFVVVFVTSDKW